MVDADAAGVASLERERFTTGTNFLRLLVKAILAAFSGSRLERKLAGTTIPLGEVRGTPAGRRNTRVSAIRGFVASCLAGGGEFYRLEG
jgi:hypothetical protein